MATKKVAIWLYKLEEKEREEAINSCEQGACIAQIWKQAVWYKETYEKVSRLIDDDKKGCLEKLNQGGVTSISSVLVSTLRRTYIGEYRKKAWEKFRNMEAELTEVADGILAKNDANQYDIYIKKQAERSEELAAIMGIQLNTLMSALDNLCTIYNITGHEFVLSDIYDDEMRNRLLGKGRWRENSRFTRIADKIVDILQDEGLML